MASYDPADFAVLYPGVFTAREERPVASFLETSAALRPPSKSELEALTRRQATNGIPGVGPTLPVTEDMVRYNNAKYDPDNLLLNDAAHARDLGYPDIPAMPCYGAHDDTFMVPYPPEARDTLLVSQLSHSVTNYRPVFPGDTLHLVTTSRRIVDRTPPEGSIHRHVAIESRGCVYNQRSEKVNDVVFRVLESVKVFRDGRRPEKMSFSDLWEGPDWMARPAHYYTDEDWDAIQSIWANERPRGDTPLYWEDVAVGDRPNPTADGPVEASVAPTAPYGMGAGGSRTLKREIMDPATRATLIRGERDGIYRTADPDDQIPPVPDGVVPFMPGGPEDSPDDDGEVDTKNIHSATEDRAVLINFLGRDIAIRHINNWMGYHGWLHSIRWSIMAPEAMAAAGKPVAADPWREDFLAKVPDMRGKTVTTHGLTGDLALVKSYVHDKYVLDGVFLADLAWWIETIDGEIWLTGGATVKLPSRLAKDKGPEVTR